MFDIALYGHLTKDIIFEDFKETNTVGAIGNVWHHLITINPDLKIHIAPSDVGEALIYVNKKKSERASVANMSLQTSWPDIKPAKINHITYLNTIKNPSYINYLKGIVSADICTGIKLNLDLLSKIDYLFISDEDMYYNMDEIKEKMHDGYIINHHAGGSVVHHIGGKEYTTDLKTLNNINVLGLGDRFAATVLNYILTSRLDFSDIVNRSHLDMTQWLEKK